MMLDYYAILRIPTDANEIEVRAAFRRLVKKYHPDVNANRKAWAHTQMRKVLDAYEILSNAGRRAAYDRELNWHENSRRDHYRERLAAKSDPASRARLVLYDLLQGNQEQALLIFEEALAVDSGFEVADHLEVKEWMDCKFLLAEQYERRKGYVRALSLYEDIYYSHLAKKHYGTLLAEVAERIRNLCCRDLARSVGPHEAIVYYERALGMNLKRPDQAFLHKKIAECYQRQGNDARALHHMKRAFALKPDLKGCSKICEKLGIGGGAGNPEGRKADPRGSCRAGRRR